MLKVGLLDHDFTGHTNVIGQRMVISPIAQPIVQPPSALAKREIRLGDNNIINLLMS